MKSDNLKPLSEGVFEFWHSAKTEIVTLAPREPFYMDTTSEVCLAPDANDPRLQSARYAMHKVRLFHYQMMVKIGEMQPDIAKQYYLAAMQNYDDMMKSSANGSFSEAIDKEMADFDINEAFSG